MCVGALVSVNTNFGVEFNFCFVLLPSAALFLGYVRLPIIPVRSRSRISRVLFGLPGFLARYVRESREDTWVTKAARGGVGPFAPWFVCVVMHVIRRM